MTRRPSETVTIKHIAARLGITYSTVSRALNDDPHASESTKARVRQAADEMGYIPHLSARAMRQGGKAGLIGLIVPDIQNVLFGQVAMALSAICNRAGFQLLLGTSLEDPVLEFSHIERLRSARANGILIAACGNSLAKSAKLLRDVPTVQLSMRNRHLDVPSVSIDNRKASMLAAQHLLQLGHARIGYVGGPELLATGSDRLEGFRSTLLDAGLVPDQDHIFQGPLRPDFGRNAIARMLSTASPPSAVVLGNAVQALGVIEGLQKRGLTTPVEFSIVMHGDPDWSRIWGGGITTVGRTNAELADEASSLLLQTIEDWDNRDRVRSAPVNLALEPYLTVRGSTAPCRIGRNSPLEVAQRLSSQAPAIPRASSRP